jgi:hypothetical protein
VWRAWLDREGNHAASEFADHLTGCAACQHVVSDLRDGATTASELLNTLAPSRLPSGADVAVAREHLAVYQRSGVRTASSRPRQPIALLVARLSTPWRVAASGVAAALVVSVAMIFSTDVQTAAAGLLSQFRPQQITAIEVTPQSQTEIMRAFAGLGNLGTLQAPNGEARPELAARTAHDQMTIVTLAEASRAVGFPLETPDPARLPAGMDGTPQVKLVPGSQMRFTFDKNKSRAHYQASGHPEMSLPDKFDGATLVVSMPAAAVLEYGSPSRNVLMIAQAGQLVVDVQGQVNLDDVRDLLLATPGLSPSVVNQLKTIKNWNQTLPLPVPVGQVNWTSASFKGNQGLLLNDNSGVGSAAVWYEGGRIYGLAGSLKATEVKSLAESLAVR